MIFPKNPLLKSDKYSRNMEKDCSHERLDEDMNCPYCEAKCKKLGITRKTIWKE